MPGTNVTLGKRIVSIVASTSLLWGLMPTSAIAKTTGDAEPQAIITNQADDVQPEANAISVMSDGADGEAVSQVIQVEEDTPPVVEVTANGAEDAASSKKASISGTWGTCSWDISSNGKLTIHAGKGVDSTGEWMNWFPWSEHIDSIKSVVFEDGVKLPKDCSNMFYECSSLTAIQGLSGCDTSAITTTSSMFSMCSLESLAGISGWDVSSLTKADHMFGWCRLSSLDLSSWKTSALKDASSMFVNSSFTSLNVSGWNTSGITDMGSMFAGCSKLTTLDVSDWDTSSATDMSEMFSGCSSLTSLDLSAWNTSSVRNLNGMFSGCSSLTSLDSISDWNVSSVTSLGHSNHEEGMFEGCSALTSLNLSKWNTSSVRDLGSLFCGCSSLAVLDVSGWDTSHVTSMAGVFTNCSSLVSLDLSSWNTSSVANLDDFHSEDMFQNCKSLARIQVGRKYKMFKSSDTMVKYSTFPDPTNADGWWSQTDKRWYTKAEIVSTRAGIADTYTNDGIPKPANLMVAKPTKPSVTVTYKKNAKNVTGANISVTDAAGALTYTNASTDPVAKKFKVNKSTGRLTIPAGTPAGTYTMKVKVTAAGDAEYKKGTKTVSYKIVVKKAANPITVKAVARKARYVTLKNKAVTVIKPLSVSGAVGTKTYTRVTHSKYCTVNKSNGKVTIKKGTPKGTYTLKIKVTAAGNSNYKSGSKTVTCKVIVK